MASDERVEAAARGAVMYDKYDGCFERVDEWEARPEEERIAYADDLPSSDYDDCEWWRRRMRAALSAAGVDALEAENARLREANRILLAANEGEARTRAERDAARRERNATLAREQDTLTALSLMVEQRDAARRELAESIEERDRWKARWQATVEDAQAARDALDDLRAGVETVILRHYHGASTVGCTCREAADLRALLAATPSEPASDGTRTAWVTEWARTTRTHWGKRRGLSAPLVAGANRDRWRDRGYLILRRQVTEWEVDE